HLEDPKHIQNFANYENTFLPWRKTMQTSLLTGKSFKDLLGPNLYKEYKQTLGFYCAPTEFLNRGRFMCAYCEQLFHDQWLLEKHLHTKEHLAKKSTYEDKDHKELVVRFGNSLFVPAIFRYNGITELADIHHDIKNRYNWRFITRQQLNEDTNIFLNNYPYDAFEGVTRVNTENENNKNNSNNHVPQPQQQVQFSKRGAVRQFPSWRKFYPNRTLVNNIPVGGNKIEQPSKRSSSAAVNGNVKRSRSELPPPVTNTNTNLHQRRGGTVAGRGHRMRGRGGNIPFGNQNFHLVKQNPFPMNSGRPTNMNNSDPNWNNNFPARPAYQRDIQNDTYSQARTATSSFGGSGGYSNFSSARGPTENYDPNFIHAVARAVAQYRPETATNLSRQIRDPGNPTNELIHHVANAIQRSNQSFDQPAPMNYSNHQQHDSFGTSYNTDPVLSYADYRSSTGPSSYASNATYTPSSSYSSFSVPSSSYTMPPNDYSAPNNSNYNRFDNTIPQQNYSSFSSNRPFSASQHLEQFSDLSWSGDPPYKNQHQQRPVRGGGIYRGQRGNDSRNRRGAATNINHQSENQGQTFSGGRNRRGQNFSSHR
ncbi:unnamed protein product, partial [Didymodactylos carnosus]